MLYEVMQNDRSNFYHLASENILVDGDSEAVGIAAWSTSNVTLSKEVTDPHSGSQLLRLTRNGGLPLAYQGINTIGVDYYVTGWARSDGTRRPAISSSTLIWQGTTSTSWQRFYIEYTAVSANLAFRTVSNAVGYVDFDDISVGLMTDIKNESTINFIRNP